MALNPQNTPNVPEGSNAASQQLSLWQKTCLFAGSIYGLLRPGNNTAPVANGAVISREAGLRSASAGRQLSEEELRQKLAAQNGPHGPRMIGEKYRQNLGDLFSGDEEDRVPLHEPPGGESSSSDVWSSWRRADSKNEPVDRGQDHGKAAGSPSVGEEEDKDDGTVDLSERYERE